MKYQAFGYGDESCASVLVVCSRRGISLERADGLLPFDLIGLYSSWHSERRMEKQLFSKNYRQSRKKNTWYLPAIVVGERDDQQMQSNVAVAMESRPWYAPAKACRME